MCVCVCVSHSLPAIKTVLSEAEDNGFRSVVILCPTTYMYHYFRCCPTVVTVYLCPSKE